MLIPDYNQDIPESTIEVARAAFPKSNPYLTLRDKLGTIYADEDFIELFPELGQPALAPWRLALVTVLQFRENLTDRQAAEAVRSRIDVKYLLGLDLTDPGFDFSVLSEFRDRLLEGKAGREAYGQTVGEDGFYLLDVVTQPDAPVGLDKLPKIEILQLVWERHYERKGQEVRFKGNKELANAPPGAESPYDPEARYRHRGGTKWIGYIGHVTETCDDANPHLITHVVTTTANLHEVSSTETIHQALVDKQLPPKQHLVDSAYVDAELLVNSKKEHGITMVGPTRKNPTWQARTDGAYDHYQFEIDWDNEQIRCPQGKVSKSWYNFTSRGKPLVKVLFRKEDCRPCQARHLCTKGTKKVLQIPYREHYEALKEQRRVHGSEEGQLVYNKRAGVEGTISQGVRAFGLRETRYRGLAKTHLQHIATAAAINLNRLVAWFDDVPRGKTRTSRFAALALI